LEGDGGNWGGPPRPKRAAEQAWTASFYNRCGAGKWAAVGRASEAAVVPVEPQDNITCGEGRAAASLVCRLREEPGECRFG
jgi:hypothetical protein